MVKWKSEKTTLYYSIPKSMSDMFYTVARLTTRMQDIKPITQDGDRIYYQITIRKGSLERFQRDLDIMRTCNMGPRREYL